jgi:hypothetical protein
VKTGVVPLALALATLAWAQSSTPSAKLQIGTSKSSKPAVRRLSADQKQWCPVLESALGVAAASEPAMRSYLVDAIAWGLGKCDPQKARRALIDSFIATLATPEKQEEISQISPRFAAQPQQIAPATMEAKNNLETKLILQESALRHLLTFDENKVESLLQQAEPEAAVALWHEMFSRATTAKKFDRALTLLNRIAAKGKFPDREIFPYRDAIQLMLELPPERDQDRQEIFRIAMATDRQNHVVIFGGDDLATMIVRFWRHLPPALVLDAIHQVLDADQPRSGVTLNAASGTVGFSNMHDYRVFELLPILKELDSDEADRLLQSSPQAQLQLKQFPNGIQSLDPAIGDTPSLPKEGEPVHRLGGAIRMLPGRLSTNPVLSATHARMREIRLMAEENPQQAIAAAATLPESVDRFSWDFPRADTYLRIAGTVMKKNPTAAKDALEAMARSLEHTSHPYEATDKWLEGFQIAKEMGEVNLALSLFRSGMDQADKLRSEDADPDDPNTALKALWPSVSAYWRLVGAASLLSPPTALQEIRKIKDPEILLLLEVRLASMRLGARTDRYTTMVHKKRSGWTGSRADE